MTVDQTIATLAGPGGLPEPFDVMLVRGGFVVRSDMAFGNGDSLDASGVRILSSVKGLLRNTVRSSFGETAAATLFGDTGRAGVVQPLALLLTSSVTGERVTMAVDAATGTVERGALSFEDVLCAGSTLELYFQVKLSLDDEPRQRTVGLVAGLMDVLSDDGAKFGTRKSVGRSVLRAREWSMRLLDLTDAGHWAAWHHAHMSADPSAGDPVPFGMAALFADLADAADLLAVIPHQRPTSLGQRAVLRLQYRGEETVGGPGDPRTSTIRQGGVRDPQSNHHPQRTGGDPDHPEREVVLGSGMMLKNHLRRSARRALLAVAARAAKTRDVAEPVRRGVEVMVSELMGPPILRGRADPRASQIHVWEEPVVRGTTLTLPRVRIHPLTNGAVDGMLMTYDVTFGPRFEVEYVCAPLGIVPLGVLALTLQALQSPLSPEMGGLAGIGHGRMRVGRVSGAIPLNSGAVLKADNWEGFRDAPLVAEAVNTVFERIGDLVRAEGVTP